MTEKSDGPRDLFGDPWSPPRDPRGRKRHSPSPQAREIVAQLKGGGASDEEISLQVGLSVPTLRKYYFRELEHGPSLARNEMLRMLYTKGKAGNVSAAKAYLAATADGRAKQAMEAPRPRREAPIGKKAERQAAAERVGGLYAPGPAPTRTH